MPTILYAPRRMDPGPVVIDKEWYKILLTKCLRCGKELKWPDIICSCDQPSSELQEALDRLKLL